jgi:hypothetical protein
MLCAVLLGVAAAAQAQQPIGTVIGVPGRDLNLFVNTNAVFGNSVTTLHVAPDGNASIVTVAIRRSATGEPAVSLYFPTYGSREISREYQQINPFDSWSFHQLIGDGASAVLRADVAQSNTGIYLPGRTRFVMLPWLSFWEIVAANPPGKLRYVHRQRARIGGPELDVALAAIDGNSLLASGAALVNIPAPQVFGQNLAKLVRSLNSNVTLLDQDVSGTGMMTTIEVR